MHSEGTLNLHHKVGLQYPFSRKTSCNRILERFLRTNDPWKAQAYDFFRFVRSGEVGRASPHNPNGPRLDGLSLKTW
jgi:hypothetical protein